jgi:hypothetical protein
MKAFRKRTPSFSALRLAFFYAKKAFSSVTSCGKAWCHAFMARSSVSATARGRWSARWQWRCSVVTTFVGPARNFASSRYLQSWKFMSWRERPSRHVAVS